MGALLDAKPPKERKILRAVIKVALVIIVAVLAVGGIAGAVMLVALARG